MALTKEEISSLIEEIGEQAEVTRRAHAKRRFDIYRDGGKAFLIEQILNEFGYDALKEMRLAPINILKKIINKRATTYKQSPIRMANSPRHQDLIDFYTEELDYNQSMLKAHRYVTLGANTSKYLIPKEDFFDLRVVPHYLYSIKADSKDKTKVDSWVFNAFTEEDRIIPLDGVPSSTGISGFSRQRGHKMHKNVIDSNERETDLGRRFIIWNDEQHLTVQQDKDGGNVTILEDPNMGDEQFMNPAGIAPIINIAKDRDNEVWASQGEDMADLALAIQMGWTDLLTIAKHQGFSQLIITSEDEPQTQQIGINKAIWLKMRDGKPTPDVKYLQASSPLGEYKELLMDLLGLLLTTNDMNANAIGGSMESRSFSSGFHALIEMADTIEATKSDEPMLRNAELEFWWMLSRWHNYMYDSNKLRADARALGRFDDDLALSIIYPDTKPIESRTERIAEIKELRDLNLITRSEALKILHPNTSDEQIEQKEAELDAETGRNQAAVLQVLQDDDSEQE